MSGIIPQKHCKYCDKTKPATPEFFFHDKNCADGWRHICKICNKKRRTEGHTPLYSMIEGQKRCSQCGQYKPKTPKFFHQEKKNQDGLHSKCKVCRNRPQESTPKGYKRCAKCKQVKLATTDYYHVAASSTDGLRSSCKKCIGTQKDPVPKGMKRCTKCMNCLPATEDCFPMHGNRLYCWCRPCRTKFTIRKPDDYERWRKANPEKSNTLNRNRHARKKSASGSHKARDIENQLQRQRGKCYYCSVKLGKKYHVDHAVPLARGGTNDPSNLVIACPHCNLSKHAKLPHEFWQGGRLM